MMTQEMTENLDEIEAMAELEAAADGSGEDKEDIRTLNERLPYVVRLSKTYSLLGEKISEVDLSGLEDLTTADAEYVDRVMSKMNYYPRNKFRDTTYLKHIAMRATNLPVEFFDSLSWKDLEAVASRIAIYFLL